MNSKHIITPLMALVIGFGAGFFTQKTTVMDKRDQELVRLQSQIERAKRFFPSEQAPVTTLSGTIKSVSRGSFILEASVSNPFQDIPLLRMVRMTDRTSIIKFEQKDSATLRAESLEFEKKIAKLQIGPGSGIQLVPLNPFRETTGTFADLKTGQSVTVTAQENIATKESFDATTVRITLISPSLPARQPPTRTR